ncbi:MAG: chemotaxis protein CheA [Gammaproteobacteria bacterium]|nr:chemotaxis protein CheA [Gammaproteobacteria bacterium]MCW9003929.1 chemotaxis protein CheA [Gammaproteobacteria bacterium]
MSIDLDDEILQDFLVEAGEILELLSEQLVELEQSPDDNDLLNAVFRGFHTIKGGAGFLAINPMVDTCHVCEDVFNVLRQGERSVSPALMDAVLQGLDAVQTMFAEIQDAQDPTPATAELLATLKKYSVPGNDEPETDVAVAAVEVPVATEQPPATASSDEADEEFDALLNAMDSDEPVAAASGSSSDDISEDEFEDLLDQIHGKGKHGGVPVDSISSPEPVQPVEAGGDDLITDDEFDNLLDEMHGKGKGPTGETENTESSASASQATDSAPASSGSGELDSDLITDDEFDNLLDEMHGKGKGPTGGADVSAAASEPVAKPAAPPAPPSPPKKEAPAAVKPAARAASPAKPAAETSVRVDTERLDEIMNLVGELVLVRNRLQTLRATMGEGQVAQAITNLGMVTSDLQSSVMKTRMQPIKKVFGRFPRVVRDLSRQIKKEIKLEMFGEETDLDKNLVEALADPLVHLVRNAVDHGIELPDEREKKGKPREGTVTLAATQEGDHILLSIEDDGAGMDPEKLRSKVVEKGLMDEETAARLDDKECFNLIFMAGFSTKEEISDISGRGVGMDVVKTRITQLNGTLDIDSTLGKGSCLSIKVPLTLAILPTLMIALGERTFALPLSNVNEIFELETRKTNVVDGQLMVMVREKAVPLFYLSKWLLQPGESSQHGEGKGQVIIVQIGNRMVGLVTDQVVGQEEVVIKPLGALLQGLPGFAGSTITGDGGIALIIDAQSLLKAKARKGF